jgi:hypothetical protein
MRAGRAILSSAPDRHSSKARCRIEQGSAMQADKRNRIEIS